MRKTNNERIILNNQEEQEGVREVNKREVTREEQISDNKGGMA